MGTQALATGEYATHPTSKGYRAFNRVQGFGMERLGRLASVKGATQKRLLRGLARLVG